jgi:hypothetical protein
MNITGHFLCGYVCSHLNYTPNNYFIQQISQIICIFQENYVSVSHLHFSDTGLSDQRKMNIPGQLSFSWSYHEAK